jgi:hypothetical protein
MKYDDLYRRAQRDRVGIGDVIRGRCRSTTMMAVDLIGDTLVSAVDRHPGGV